jgi:hypothetical protein
MTPEALRTIRTNIAETGHHTYLVSGGPTPRFAYTIGLSVGVGFELVVAGAAFYGGRQVKDLVDVLAAQVRRDGATADAHVGALGRFRLVEVCEEWSRPLMLGAYDFYGDRDLRFQQVVPDEDHRTIDVPDMSSPWTGAADGAWRWQFEEWPFPVPRSSIAMTNLAALRGSPITEMARWEEDQWELFAGPGPEVRREDARAFSLGALIGADRSLEVATQLPVGGAVWRRPDESTWHAWAKGRA